MVHHQAVETTRIPDLLDRWVGTGVITEEQAARMRADLRESRLARAGSPSRQGSLAIEALGYLGSVLVVVASVLLASRYWYNFSTLSHLALVGGAAIALAVGGFAVPARLGPPAVRLRAVLRLAATVATAGFLGLLGDEVLTWHDEDLALLVFGGTTVCATALWWRLRTVVQLAAVFVGLAGTAATAAAQLDGSPDLLPGLGIWGVGALWFVLGWGTVISPRWAALILGALGLMIGSGMTMATDGGVVLALVTVAALVTLALLAKDLLMLGLGAWGALQILPMAVNRWFPSELAAAVVLLVAGLLLVLIAVWVAHRRRDAGPDRGAALASAPILRDPRQALVVGAALAVVVAVSILVLGLS
ncbi:DUF2157 domain-containing protein [Kribbella sp. NPDC020789]